MPTVDEIRQRLQDQGFKVVAENRLPNDSGTQIRLTNGGIVNCYDKGTFLVQGAEQEAVKAALGEMDQPPRKGRAIRPTPTPAAAPKSAPEKVFVVYGHDQKARDELEAMLRRWDLEPLLLDQLPSEGQTIIEKLEATQDLAKFAVVLATPDDVGYASGRESEKTFRARQNVVLELGMMLTALGRAKVAILIKNPSEMERPSDIQGLIYIPFSEHVSETRVQLAKEMDKQGLKISVGRL